MDGELAWAPASTLRDLVARGEVSPVELVTECLARIDALEPTLHAFITVDADGALDAARRAEAQAHAGEALGPLHGVPIAVKDDQWVAGMRATAGSLLFGAFRPSIDSTAIERLRRAGAIVVGKTNMPEFAAWPRSKSRLAGESVNPWDPTRIAGASSGGSAAAVVSGMVPIATGSDGGGSIRIPSALCGTVGLYPTLGRVPGYGTFHCSPLGSAGPMARTVADVALVEQVIAGPDPRVPSIATPPPDVLAALDTGVEGLRIAWSPDFGRIPVDPRIVAVAQAALAALGAAGASVEEIGDRIEHPWGDGSLLADLQAAVVREGAEVTAPTDDLPDLTGAEAWLLAGVVASEVLQGMPVMRELCTRYRHLLTPPQQLAISLASGGAPLPTVEELRGSMNRVFAAHDVLCSPTMAVVAPVAPDDWSVPYADPYMGTNFTFIANATECPAASVPCGLVDGLPVGFQIIGRPGDEPTVLRVARAIEAAIGSLPRPPVSASVLG